MFDSVAFLLLGRRKAVFQYSRGFVFGTVWLRDGFAVGAASSWFSCFEGFGFWNGMINTTRSGLFFFFVFLINLFRNWGRVGCYLLCSRFGCTGIDVVPSNSGDVVRV